MPMQKPLQRLTAQTAASNKVPAVMVQINADTAELYRNAATHAREIGLDGEFVAVLAETAKFRAREVDGWSKRAQ